MSSTMAPKALPDLPGPLPFPSSLPPHPTQSASATQASSLFLQHARHSPAPGPLHRLFLRLRTPFLHMSPGLSPSRYSDLSSDVPSSLRGPP